MKFQSFSFYALCLAQKETYPITNVSHARVIPDDDQLEELRLANTTNVYNTSAQSVENLVHPIDFEGCVGHI